MKSTKIAITAIIVAALMVIPIAFFTVGDDSSSTGPTDFLKAPEINEDKLVELIGSDAFQMASPAPVNQNVSSVEKESGEYICLSKNFVFDKDATITFKSGSSMTFYPAQAFSISSAADGYAALIFKAGSHIYVTTNDSAPTPGENGNIITDIEIEADTAFYFNGKISYTKGAAFNFGIIIDKGSKIYDGSKLESMKVLAEFNEQNKVVVKSTEILDPFAMTLSLKGGSVEIVADFKTPMDEDEDAAIKGSAKFNFEISVPMSKTSSLKDIVVKISGGGEFTADAASYYTATLKIDIPDNLTYTIIDCYGQDKDTSLTGTVSFDVVSTDVDNRKVSDNPETYVTIKGNNASIRLNIDNTGFTADVSTNVGMYKTTTVSESGDITLMLEGFNINGTYAGAMKTENINPVLTAILNLTKIKPSSVIEEYMNGVKNLQTEEEIKKYASDFFLGKFDETSGLSGFGIESKSLRANISIQRMNFLLFDIQGASIGLEISESVGVRANMTLDMFKSDGFDLIIISIPNIYITSANATLSTSTDVENKSMFTVDFNGSIQSKQYNNGLMGDGQFISDQYVKNINVKATMAEKNTIESLTISDYGYSNYGVYLTASNLTMDVENKVFNLDEMKISGNYYGSAHIRSVEGYYKNVTLTPGLKMTPAVESVNIRFYDVDGDYTDFTRTYDATTKVITNTYSVEGQMYFLNDIINDDFEGLMFVGMKGAENDAKEIFVFNGQLLTPGVWFDVDDMTFDVTDKPCLIVSGTEISLDLDPPCILKAPAQVFVSTSTNTMVHSSEGMIKINGEIHNIDFYGVALGVSVDANGAITYSLVALPGYTLSTNMGCTGMTIVECDEKTATITLTGTDITCNAVPVKYKLSIDGVEIKNDVAYQMVVEGTGLDENVVMLIGENGSEACYVQNGAWSILYSYTKDMDFKTMKTTKITEVKTDEINKVDSEGVSFTVPDGVEDLLFEMPSKVRFELAGLDTGYSIDIIAEKTSYDGHDAFMIKARCDGEGMGATLYLPVSGPGQKLMHADREGRVSEYETTEVVIDGQTYLRFWTDNFSYFYSDADVSPIDPPGKSNDNTVLFIVIGVVAAVAVAAVAVFIIKKH